MEGLKWKSWEFKDKSKFAIHKATKPLSYDKEDEFRLTWSLWKVESRRRGLKRVGKLVRVRGGNKDWSCKGLETQDKWVKESMGQIARAVCKK